MKNDEIDTAIAEFCGWTEITSVPESGRLWGKRPDSRDDGFNIAAVPQYHKCLNAMHDAEKTLLLGYEDDPDGSEIWSDYQTNLIITCAAYLSYHATAMERAHALLRTIGKYQEPEKLSTHCAV